MGYDVRVDCGRLATVAATLTDVGQQLEEAAEAIARTLTVVAGAAGGGALADVAGGLASTWRRSLGEVAGHGLDLARATAEAAERYAEVERLQTSVWGVGGGTRWAP